LIFFFILKKERKNHKNQLLLHKLFNQFIESVGACFALLAVSGWDENQLIQCHGSQSKKGGL